MAVAITQTADPAGVNGASNVCTYSGASIGTASSDRVVVVLCGGEVSAVTPASATIDFGSGDTAMNAAPLASFGNMNARIFWLLVATGTTATIKVTHSGGTPTSVQNHIAVYAVTGGQPWPYNWGTFTSTDMDATAPLTAVTTIVANGGMIAVAACATDTVAKTWANITEDLDEDAGDFRFTTAKLASATVDNNTRTCTGGTNNEDGALAWLHFSPTAANFGDLLGSTSAVDNALGTSIAATCSISVSVGDLIVAMLAERGNLTVTAVNDNLGNSYTAQNAGSDAGNATGRMFYSYVTVAGTLSTITATTNGGGTEAAVFCVAGYKGPFTNPPIDANPANLLNDGASPWTTNLTGTLAQADELIVSWAAIQIIANIMLATAPNEVHSNNINPPLAIAGYVGAWVVAATTSVSAAWTSISTSSNVLGIASFMKGAPAFTWYPMDEVGTNYENLIRPSHEMVDY